MRQLMRRLTAGVFVSAILLSLGTGSVGSQAKSGNGECPLFIGVLPEQNIFRQMERYSPVLRYVSQQTGTIIRLKPFTSYEDAMKSAASSSIDGAFFGSFTCALAQRRMGAETLARPEALDGTSTYHGLIFVRKDSRIRKVRDMKGKRFAFVNRVTTAGYLLPLFYFSRNGIRDYKTYLGEAYFAGTHEDAIYDVLKGKADIGAAKNTVYHRLAARDPRIQSELKILTRSPDVPENALALGAAVDPSVKTRIREVLLTMHDNPDGRAILQAFGARKFVATTGQDYQPIFDYSKQIGIDLEHFDPTDNQ